MDGTPFFVMGLMVGVGFTLVIQWLANRKVRKAVADVRQARAEADIKDAQLRRLETAEMNRRLAVLEQIITDRPHRLAHEIEELR